MCHHMLLLVVFQHVIKYRFDTIKVEKLLNIQWWKKDEEWIVKHSEYFEDIDKFLIKVEREKTGC